MVKWKNYRILVDALQHGPNKYCSYLPWKNQAHLIKEPAQEGVHGETHKGVYGETHKGEDGETDKGVDGETHNFWDKQTEVHMEMVPT